MPHPPNPLIGSDNPGLSFKWPPRQGLGTMNRQTFGATEENGQAGTTETPGHQNHGRDRKGLPRSRLYCKAVSTLPVLKDDHGDRTFSKTHRRTVLPASSKRPRSGQAQTRYAPIPGQPKIAHQPIEPFRKSLDSLVLGDCNFQFYDSTARANILRSGGVAVFGSRLEPFRTFARLIHEAS